MKTILPPPSLARSSTAKLPPHECALVADWRRFLFVHYSLPPEILAPHVPYELDLFEGRAFVSLVYFTLERMRPPFLPGTGEVLLRPISNHPFLNVRTYVRHAENEGICFLAEWIPNRLSELLGPWLYGLPYRFGEFDCEVRANDGVAHLVIEDPRARATLGITYPLEIGAGERCETETVDAFLLERYRAYTFRGPTRRHFTVAHEPWLMRPLDWIRTDTSLIETVFPWFKAATFHSAHASPGVTGVEMSWPHRVD